MKKFCDVIVVGGGLSIVTRAVGDNSNVWESESLKDPQWRALKLKKPSAIS